jgi:excisionase family DNA binding protein
MTTAEVLALPAAVTIKQTSRALGVSLDSAYAAARNGELPVIRLGKRMVVPKTFLLDALGLANADPSSKPSDPVPHGVPE